MYPAACTPPAPGRAPTVDGDLLVGEEVEELRVDGAGLALLRVALGQHGHHVGRRLERVRAQRLVRARLVRRPAPAAADHRELAARQPASHTRQALSAPALDVFGSHPAGATRERLSVS